MYDDYSYDSREDDRYYEPPPSRKGRRGPPPDEYPPEDEYEPEPPSRRGPPRGKRGPPSREPKYKPPRGPNQIPGMITICVIVGIILMFIGLTLLTFATPTTSPPEIPSEGVDDPDYVKDLLDWELEYGNSYRNKETIKQVGIVIHDLGALIAGLALLCGGLVFHDLDMKLRTTLIIGGIILIVIMFMIPLAWSTLTPPSYGNGFF